MAITNRTNTFQVRDTNDFIRSLKNEGFTEENTIIKRGEDNKVSLRSRDAQEWGTPNGDTELEDIIMAHIVPGAVAVLMKNEPEFDMLGAYLITSEEDTYLDFEEELITAAAALVKSPFTNLD